MPYNPTVDYPEDADIPDADTDYIFFKGVRTGNVCDVFLYGKPKRMPGSAVVREAKSHLDPKLELLDRACGTGFDWGHTGLGPAQLALAILCAVEGKDFALAHHQRYKQEVISPIDGDLWTIHYNDVAEWASKVRKELDDDDADS